MATHLCACRQVEEDKIKEWEKASDDVDKARTLTRHLHEAHFRFFRTRLIFFFCYQDTSELEARFMYVSEMKQTEAKALQKLEEESAQKERDAADLTASTEASKRAFLER